MRRDKEKENVISGKVISNWKKVVNSWVSIEKSTPQRPYYYNGWLLGVEETHLVIDDRVLGNIRLPLSNLTLLGVDESKGKLPEESRGEKE